MENSIPGLRPFIYAHAFIITIPLINAFVKCVGRHSPKKVMDDIMYGMILCALGAKGVAECLKVQSCKLNFDNVALFSMNAANIASGFYQISKTIITKKHNEDPIFIQPEVGNGIVSLHDAEIYLSGTLPQAVEVTHH